MGITLPIALFFGVLQGASELFPVSSLGHAVVVPPLLGLGVRETDPDFLPFLVLLHIGTATALIVLYWRQWVRIVAGFFRSVITGRVSGGDERLAWLLVVGTIPAGIVGFIFQTPLQSNFGNPRLAAGLLIVNGAMLLGAEMLRRRTERRAGMSRRDPKLEAGRFRSVEEMGFGRAALVGACQVVALFPGISRSGSTMAGGLIAGLRHEEAVRFSFLLATPIILAAGLLELPSLAGTASLGPMIVGGVAAGLTAYASARFLVRYFRVGRLDPYAYYCAGLGVLGLALLR
ncbi:MAG: undecaprenyl-diphosphate phosphatase [Candidatus Dormibacteria bacterium]